MNRAAEGLRVLGELARFVINSPHLAETARDIRQSLNRLLLERPGAFQHAIADRDSETDVGRKFEAGRHQSLVDVCRANARRAEESVRVLEEYLRSVSVSGAAYLSDVRYRIYSLEKDLTDALAPYEIERKMDFSLYVVLGREQSRGRDFMEVTQSAIEGGAGAIQLRDKDMGKRDLLNWAYRLRELTQKHGVTFIVNDHIDIALATAADGVHLGQDDFPIPQAREILGPTMIVGASTHSVDQALKAEEEGASYINVGPIFPTGTKKGGHPPVGPELLRAVLDKVSIPVTTMGGIGPSNIDLVLAQGAQRVAVVSAVVGAENIREAAEELRSKIDTAKAT